MGFYVKFDDVRSINEVTDTQLGQWKEQLDSVQECLEEIVNFSGFQGTAATSVKSYFSEVHGILMAAVQGALADYMMKYHLFRDGYYEIDADIHTKLKEDTLNQTVKNYQKSQGTLEDIQKDLKTAIDDTRDIFYPGIPGINSLEDACGAEMKLAQDTIEKVNDYEDQILNNEIKELETLIAAVRSYIKEFLAGDRAFMVKYVSGDILNSDSIYNLAVQMEAAGQYAQLHRQDLQDALDRDQMVYEQLQREYEAELERLAEERADNGVAQMIMGGIAIAVGVGAIVFTAGAATPVVAVAVVSGTCATAYGVSEMAEGGQHVYYGWNGDPYTSAWNPLRDTIFMGNQEMYSLWGNLSVTVASLCLPVGKSTKGMQGMQLVKQTAKTVAKETFIDKTAEFMAGYVAPVISDSLHVESNTGKLLVNLSTQAIFSKGLEKGMDKASDFYIKKEIRDIRVEAEQNGQGFAGLMDETDRVRYEEYWNQKKMDNPQIVIKERTGDLDLTEHPLERKQLSETRKKELRQKLEDRTMTREEYKEYDWDRRLNKRRVEGVREFWRQEKSRLENGEAGTRNWTPEQRKAILEGNIPKYDGKPIEAHHTYSVSRYPQLANKGEVLYPATKNEHFHGWHGGNWKNSEPGAPIKNIRDF